MFFWSGFEQKWSKFVSITTFVFFFILLGKNAQDVNFKDWCILDHRRIKSRRMVCDIAITRGDAYSLLDEK